MSEPAAKRARTESISPVEIAADLAECSKQLSAKIREVKDSKAKVAKVSSTTALSPPLEYKYIVFVLLHRMCLFMFQY